MNILRALIVGLNRVLASPMLILGVYAISLVLALPLAFAMRGILERTRGDLTMALRQRSLEQKLASLEGKVSGD